MNWFRRGADASVNDNGLQTQLEGLEQQIQDAPDEMQPTLLNRAGDLCIQAKRRGRALDYFGRAIDLYLRAGRFEPAAALCRKVIRCAPDVVRAHATLALLAVWNNDANEARVHLRNFVHASQRSKTERLATARLRLIAAAVSQRSLKEFLAARLGEMGDDLGRRRLLEELSQSPDGDASQFWSEGESFDALLHAALVGADELWKYG